jgi:hypothetical protein
MTGPVALSLAIPRYLDLQKAADACVLAGAVELGAETRAPQD